MSAPFANANRKSNGGEGGIRRRKRRLYHVLSLDNLRNNYPVYNYTLWSIYFIICGFSTNPQHSVAYILFFEIENATATFPFAPANRIYVTERVGFGHLSKFANFVVDPASRRRAPAFESFSTLLARVQVSRQAEYMYSGGEGGIRTHGALASSTH